MELLAPAGNVENFHAALKAGADAVYVGLPGFNARNLSRDLQLEEIGAMIEHCHDREKKLYVAANSLLLERELSAVIEILAVLSSLQPDALIVQDLGLINIVRRYFPTLRLHASTLVAAHNLSGVELFGRFGCDRVVLARELTLAEIRAITARAEIEVEVFVHGAMCFSYSGLCLFSSYLGGKSGLRGRCVQPCRRGYGQGGKRGGKGGRSGYLFSMNDLDGLEAVPELVQSGVASIKIEGRQRSARYVEKVVSAYRLMLDADAESAATALPQARDLIGEAMSRKTGPGYFFSPQPPEAISPLHSGNLGLHLGRSTGSKGTGGDPKLILRLKAPLALGDRLRLHFEPSGERLAFSLKGLEVDGSPVEQGASGDEVQLSLPPEASGRSWHHLDCYKVDLARDGGATGRLTLPTRQIGERIAGIRRQQGRQIEAIQRQVWADGHPRAAINSPGPKSSFSRRQRPGKRGEPARLPIEWWLKLDTVKPLLGKMELRPDRYLVTLDRTNVSQAGELKRLLGKGIRNVTWALPAILTDREFGRLGKQVSILIRAGFRSYQLGHCSQLTLFGGERVFLSADYTCNLLNNQALLLAAEVGFECGQLAIEADREALREAVQGYKQTGVPALARGGGKRGMRLGLTVYGAPPLFTARIAAPFFPYERPVISPKHEEFVIRKKDGLTYTRAIRPFSLLPYLHELKQSGLDYVVVDLCGGLAGRKQLRELAERLAGTTAMPKLPTFNYLGQLA
ncbi:MAG: peptidase U32 family protein [Desulfopila sp.]